MCDVHVRTPAPSLGALGALALSLTRQLFLGAIISATSGFLVLHIPLARSVVVSVCVCPPQRVLGANRRGEQIHHTKCFKLIYNACKWN